MATNSPTPLPSMIVHADWGSNPGQRWMAKSTLRNGRYLVHAPEPVGNSSTLTQRTHADAGEAAALIGFDFPIGLPVGYAEQAGVQDFLALLPRLGHGEWSNFYDVADRLDQIGFHRPFYPNSPFPKGSKKHRHLLDSLHVASIDDLRRRCDKARADRQAAETIFWTLGPKAVGKAANLGWKEVLTPALANTANVKAWPFDGMLRDLIQLGNAVIIETYPAEFYRQLGIVLKPGKRSQEARQQNADTLFQWAHACDVELDPKLDVIIENGFGPSPDGEDPFDATIGLFGMLNVLLGNQQLYEPTDVVTRKIEGWMFGQSANSDETNNGSERKAYAYTPPIEDDPPSEYRPLADLYDLEYTHDYDLPFWLSLAEREARPVVEWGAGTGRISVPLAAAGHDVTAVEISGRMVERGKEKGGTVEWIVGDMRSVDAGRRYGLAICAFNSFLCLKSVDDASAFLRNAHEHLMPGGLLGIEVSAFLPEELVDPPGGPALRHDFTRVLPDGRLDRFSVSHYDAATQLMQMRLFYERYDASGTLESRRAHDLTIRIVGRSELELILQLTGFEVEAVYGSFEGEPFTSTSDHLIVLARK